VKFKQSGKNEYRAYSNPFTFWLFLYDNYVDIVAHYGASTLTHREKKQEEAKKWCYKYALKKTLQQLEDVKEKDYQND